MTSPRVPQSVTSTTAVGEETANRSASTPTGSGVPALDLTSPTAPRRPIGRIPVRYVQPVVDNGNRPAKSVVDETFDITAVVFREGHDAVNATVVLTDPEGIEHAQPMTLVNAGLDTWAATVHASHTGRWSYRVEGWADPYRTWQHDAVIKIGAGVDVELMLEEGARVLERAAAQRTSGPAGVLTTAAARLRDVTLDVDQRLAAGTSDDVDAELLRQPLRDGVTASEDYPWLVERERALYGAWYEIFPRNEGAVQNKATGLWQSGTFASAANRLPAIAAMGFDVVYLTPIHPIGRVNRKGPNNTLDASDTDPGSPYAVGSADGGHDAVHPDLGTFDDFDRFVTRASELGMEVAVDFAFHGAPDHPWVAEHPEWFTTRADGTIAYAENPPKKYQDIYPLNFDNDPSGLYAEIRRVVQVWLDHGIRIFRVDNPHTKTVELWEWLIADVARDYPEVIWLAEAFTRPAMMHTLAEVGFQQSYTYYAWRHSREELEEYCRELAGPAAAYMRPSFWPTTHDILTPFMQRGGPTAWRLRAALAATLVPTYGIYAGYELIENAPRPGAEEQLDNEKYQYRDRRWADYEPGGTREGESLAPYLTALNTIRRAHPALHWLRNLHFHTADDGAFLVYSKRRSTGDRDDVVIVVANLDPDSIRDTWIHLDLEALGMAPGERFTAHDLLTGDDYDWGSDNFVRLGANFEPVHLIAVKRYGSGN